MLKPLPLGLAAGLVATAFVVGVFLGSDGAAGDKALRLLAALGAPRYEAVRSAYAPDADERASYLLFFDEASAEDPRVEAFLAARPELEITGYTVFANAVVLSGPPPPSPWVEALRAEPFVWLLLRDRPFFFCH